VNLRGAVAVVTGATQGIGRATAFRLGQDGARVAICARTPERLQATERELREAGVDAIGLPCDVSDAHAVERFAAFVTRERGTPDVIVNNAGIGRFRPLEELPIEDWDAMMRVNVRSLFLVTRAFLPGMKQAGRGSIVNVASLAGRNGIEGGTAYCASKHAVLGFSKALMLEVRTHNIRVLTICPGTVATGFRGREVPREADRVLSADDVAESIHTAIALPDRAMLSELDLRPTNP
jgi:3-oxoacyl-[acyl-carrier protein] reductase